MSIVAQKFATSIYVLQTERVVIQPESSGCIVTGHGGRDRMLKHLNQKYANITTEAVELYTSYCLVCQEKQKRPRNTGVVVKPLLSRDWWTSQSRRHAVKPTRSVQVDNGLSMPPNKVCNPQGFVIKEIC